MYRHTTYLIFDLDVDLVHVEEQTCDMHRWTGEGLDSNAHAHFAGDAILKFGVVKGRYTPHDPLPILHLVSHNV